MDLSALRGLLDEQRKNLRWPGDLTEIGSFVTRRGSLDGQRCMVEFSALNEENADQIIEEEVEHFAELGVPFEWKLFSHDQPQDLGERLTRAGFIQGPEEAVMIHDLASTLPKAPKVVVKRVSPGQVLDDFRMVAEAVFNKDYSLTASELAEGREEHVAFVAYADDMPVSIGRVYTHPDAPFAGLYGGGTLSSHRGQGYYRAIVSARAEFAKARGARYLQVDALPTSRPILERSGFVQIASTWAYDYALQA